MKAKADTVQGNVAKLRVLVDKLVDHPEGIEFHAVSVDLCEGVGDLYRTLKAAERALKHAEQILAEWHENDIMTREDDMGNGEEYEVLVEVRKALRKIDNAS